MDKDPRNLKILVVDDEDRLLRILRLGLKQKGYEVRTVSDGEAAFEEILSQSYDLVIMDVRMPRLNGMELIYELERLNVEIPIIVMTAYANVETAVKSLKHGAFDYIQKPFTVDELDKVINGVLKELPKDQEQEVLPSLQHGVEEKEKELIQRALVKSGNVKTKAALLLNISERTLWYKIKKYNLE